MPSIYDIQTNLNARGKYAPSVNYYATVRQPNAVEPRLEKVKADPIKIDFTSLGNALTNVANAKAKTDIAMAELDYKERLKQQETVDKQLKIDLSNSLAAEVEQIQAGQLQGLYNETTAGRMLRSAKDKYRSFGILNDGDISSVVDHNAPYTDKAEADTAQKQKEYEFEISDEFAKKAVETNAAYANLPYNRQVAMGQYIEDVSNRVKTVMGMYLRDPKSSENAAALTNATTEYMKTNNDTIMSNYVLNAGGLTPANLQNNSIQQLNNVANSLIKEGVPPEIVQVAYNNALADIQKQTKAYADLTVDQAKTMKNIYETNEYMYKNILDSLMTTEQRLTKHGGKDINVGGSRNFTGMINIDSSYGGYVPTVQSSANGTEYTGIEVPTYRTLGTATIPLTSQEQTDWINLMGSDKVQGKGSVTNVVGDRSLTAVDQVIGTPESRANLSPTDRVTQDRNVADASNKMNSAAWKANVSNLPQEMQDRNTRNMEKSSGYFYYNQTIDKSIKDAIDAVREPLVAEQNKLRMLPNGLLSVPKKFKGANYIISGDLMDKVESYNKFISTNIPDDQRRNLSTYLFQNTQDLQVGETATTVKTPLAEFAQKGYQAGFSVYKEIFEGVRDKDIEPGTRIEQLGKLGGAIGFLVKRSPAGLVLGTVKGAVAGAGIESATEAGGVFNLVEKYAEPFLKFTSNNFKDGMEILKSNAQLVEEDYQMYLEERGVEDSNMNKLKYVVQVVKNFVEPEWEAYTLKINATGGLENALQSSTAQTYTDYEMAEAMMETVGKTIPDMATPGEGPTISTDNGESVSTTLTATVGVDGDTYAVKTVDPKTGDVIDPVEATQRPDMVIAKVPGEGQSSVKEAEKKATEFRNEDIAARGSEDTLSAYIKGNTKDESTLNTLSNELNIPVKGIEAARKVVNKTNSEVAGEWLTKFSRWLKDDYEKGAEFLDGIYEAVYSKDIEGLKRGLNKAKNAGGKDWQMLKTIQAYAGLLGGGVQRLITEFFEEATREGIEYTSDKVEKILTFLHQEVEDF